MNRYMTISDEQLESLIEREDGLRLRAICLFDRDGVNRHQAELERLRALQAERMYEDA